MKSYYYLVLTPESLIASHLPPAEFGNYLAVGTKKQTRSQSIFFEVDGEKMPELPLDYIRKKLVPYESGEPKRSVYFSIYRALEMTPLDALKNLYVVTDDGIVLEISPGEYMTSNKDEIHLYQQFSPITTRVASKLTPPEFISFLTDPSKPVNTPEVFLVELQLNELAYNPYASLDNLPYPNPDHLRECIMQMIKSPQRKTKTVLRFASSEISYRTIKDGFFVGDRKRTIFYPFPSVDNLENKYYHWWKSALVQHF
jgi:hypothetical protein